MATAENHKTNGKRPSRSKHRRDTENEVFNELADLLPISDDMEQDKLSVLRLTIAYMKMRSALESDEQDLEECLLEVGDGYGKSGYEFDPYCEPEHAPLAMLDNEGNLIAGSLNMHNLAITEPINITLPDTVSSDLEKQFICGSGQRNEIQTQKEKFQKYKEHLERGMQEFLNNDPSDMLCDYSISASTRKQTGEKGNTLCLTNPKDLSSRQAIRDIYPENRDCRSAKTDQKMVTKPLSSRAGTEKTDEQLALTRSIQDRESSISLEAATGFIVSLDKNRRVLFVSENVSKYLGHCQSFLIGQDVSEFIYEEDYPELERQMSDTQFLKDGAGRLQSWQIRRTFYMAMKFSFQKSGSKAKDCGCQLYQWNAKLQLYKDKSTGDIRVKGLTSLCCPLLRGSLLSMNDNANMFVMRFSVKDSTILYCDAKVENLLGYDPSDLVGVKRNDLKHPADLYMSKCNTRNLPRDGKCVSGYYRLLSRYGAWIWLYTYSTIIYNKNGEPDVLVMKSIIVSQAEAKCVLSREKRDFDKLNCLSDNADQLTRGKTLASIAYNKQRKKTKTNLDCPPTSRSEINTGQSKTLETSTSVAGQSNLSNKNLQQLQAPRSPSPQQLQPTQIPVTTSQKNKKPITKVKDSPSLCDDKLNNAKRLLYDTYNEVNSGQITQQIEHCISEDTVMDSCPSSGYSSHSQTKSDFNLTNPGSSMEMLFSQNTPSMTEDSTSFLGLSSLQQDWALDSLHFDNDLQDTSFSLFSNISETDLQDTSSSFFSSPSEASVTNNSGPSPAQTSQTSQELDNVIFMSNYQQVQKRQVCVDQRNTVFPNSGQVLTSSSIQSQLDDQCLDGFLDVSAEEHLPASKALMTPFSGDILLSSLSAPQLMKSKQNQHNHNFDSHLNMPGFHSSTLETKYQSKQCYSDNLAGKGVDASFKTSKTKVATDHVVPDSNVYQGMVPFTLNKSLQQPGIISSTEQLSFPSVLEKSKRRDLEGVQTFDSLEDFHVFPLNVARNNHLKEDVQKSGTKSSQRNVEVIHQPGINNYNNISQIPQADKIMKESARMVVHDPSVNGPMVTAVNEDNQLLNSAHRTQTGISSRLAGTIVPDFCGELDQSGRGTNKPGVLLTNTFSDMKNKNGLITNNSLGDPTCPKEGLLPEDLLDVELDFDFNIAVGLNENLLHKYL